jgi:hypothetical protein
MAGTNEWRRGMPEMTAAYELQGRTMRDSQDEQIGLDADQDSMASQEGSAYE